MLAARVEQKNGTYLHSIQRDRRSLPHPAGVAMFGINPDRRSHWGIITRHTAGRLGIHCAPHDVRDAAATTWAIAAPDRIGVSRDLLAHCDLRTTTRHYNRARGI